MLLTKWLNLMVKLFNSPDKNTEERILEAAKTEFMKFGMYGARMQHIADAARINKALLHYYFRSKEKLFDKVFEGALEKYLAQMDVLDDASIPLKKRLFKYIDNLVDFLTEYPQISMFIIKEISVSPEMFREKVHALKKTKGIKLSTVLEAEMNTGNIKKTDLKMFIINLQSLCYYPFLASPLYKNIFKMNSTEWKDTSTVKLKKSVKAFVEHSLGL